MRILWGPMGRNNSHQETKLPWQFVHNQSNFARVGRWKGMLNSFHLDKALLTWQVLDKTMLLCSKDGVPSVTLQISLKDEVNASAKEFQSFLSMVDGLRFETYLFLLGSYCYGIFPFLPYMSVFYIILIKVWFLIKLFWLF